MEFEKTAVNCDVTMEKAKKRQPKRNRRLGEYWSLHQLVSTE